MKRTHAMMNAAALSLVAAGLAYGLPSCAQREPKIGFPPLNKTFTLKPAVMNHSDSVRLKSSEMAAIAGLHVTVMWGGRPMSDDDIELRFYKTHGRATPDLAIRWGDLTQLYRTSGCSSEQIASLDGPGIGVALVCDGRIKLDQFVLIEGVDKKGEKRSATSWATWRLADDIAAASIQLL